MWCDAVRSRRWLWTEEFLRKLYEVLISKPCRPRRQWNQRNALGCWHICFEWNANTISTVLNMLHLLWFYHLLLSYSIPFQFASITPFHLWLCVPSGLWTGLKLLVCMILYHLSSLLDWELWKERDLAGVAWDSKSRELFSQSPGGNGSQLKFEDVSETKTDSKEECSWVICDLLLVNTREQCEPFFLS